MRKDKETEKSIELNKDALCKLKLFGPGETLIDMQGIFKGYLDFMGEGVGLLFEISEDNKTFNRIVPYSSIIFIDILKEGTPEEIDENAGKAPDNMFY